MYQLIPTQLKFKTEDILIIQSWDRTLWYLENEIVTLLILSELYNRKIITLDKLKGQLKSLKKGDLLKHKGTYHCTINNQWYSDEPAKNVFKDLFITYKLDTINISTLINTIQLYLNKNYNYCIDYMVSNIYPKLLNTFSYSYLDIDYLSQFIDTNLIHFPKIKHKGYCSECYECGNSHFELNHRGTIAQIEDIINYFHHYKKGNLTKIPKQTL